MEKLTAWRERPCLRKPTIPSHRDQVLPNSFPGVYSEKLTGLAGKAKSERHKYFDGTALISHTLLIVGNNLCLYFQRTQEV
jgi:hypothetical protein